MLPNLPVHTRDTKPIKLCLPNTNTTNPSTTMSKCTSVLSTLYQLSKPFRKVLADTLFQNDKLHTSLKISGAIESDIITLEVLCSDLQHLT